MKRHRRAKRPQLSSTAATTAPPTPNAPNPTLADIGAGAHTPLALEAQQGAAHVYGKDSGGEGSCEANAAGEGDRWPDDPLGAASLFGLTAAFPLPSFGVGDG